MINQTLRGLASEVTDFIVSPADYQKRQDQDNTDIGLQSHVLESLSKNRQASFRILF
jgi:hypothetical protein